MPALLKEPLFYFAAIGGLLFVLYRQVADPADRETFATEEIVLTQGRIEALEQGFKKVWQRRPTSREREGLIDEFIREEVFYREALAMGLDRDDTIVRRRMRQKVEFLSQDILPIDDPSDQQLAAFLAEHAARFRQPDRFSFRQIFLNTSERGPSVVAEAEQRLAKLRQLGAHATMAGDPLMISDAFERISEYDIARTLGETFLRELAQTPTGSWQGPVESGYGLHLVFISEHSEGSVPPLAEIRKEVAREWSVAQRALADEAFYQSLRQRYQVTRPPAAEPLATASTEQRAASLP